MKAAWRKYLGARAPRYTSYPSALHFDQSVTARDFTEKLHEIQLYDPLSLYVHVPFCRQLCWYCGCNMRVENDYARARDYVDALIGEIALQARALGGKGRPTSIHFGGGTPNYLSCDDLADILGAIEREVGLTDCADVAIELDPRMLRDGHVGRLASLGFNRFSLGVQDLDPLVQEAINRIQSFDLIESCVSDIRAGGVDDLSFDILYGLPRQSEDSFSQTLDKVIALSPDRVSVFGYAHLPDALPHQRMIDPQTLPDETLRAALSAMADELLTGAGYLRIGFDHYAKPDNALARAALAGRLKRNFQGFTDDAAATQIGFGASAISFVDGLYAQNEKSVAAYKDRVRRGAAPVARGLVRTRREAVIAAAIHDLLCRLEADVGAVLKTSPPADAIRLCSALERFEADGIIRWDGDRIAIVEGAHPLARAVATALDPYAQRQVEYAAAV